MHGFHWIRWMVCVCIACFVSEDLTSAQSPLDGRPAVNRDEVRSRLRPIGSPSAVDAFSPSRNPIRQVAMMQAANDGSFVPPPSLQGTLGMPNGPLPQGTTPMPPLPPQNLPRNNNLLPEPLNQLPLNQLPLTQLPLSQPNSAAPNGGLRFQQPGTNFGTNTFGQPARPGASDYAPIAPPQLGNDFASLGNCRNISGPSTYRAAGLFGCNAPANYAAPIYGPTTYGTPTTYVAPPAQIAPAIGLPPGAFVAPAGYGGSLPPVLPGNPGFRPLLSFGQEKNPVQVGQGLLGQPVAYVPGQFIRNALRYVSF